MSKTLLMIDNYDSFTYNLVQYFGDLGWTCDVHRNDIVCASDLVNNYSFDGIVISPGPSDPNNAGVCLDVIMLAAEKEIPLLGVCLGHQCIGQIFGGKIIRTHPMHGKTSDITHDQKGVFADIPSPYKVTRYHSLIIDKDTLPNELEITAQTDDNIIMGIQHKTKPIHGVQFHPESIATEHGHKLLKNFAKIL